MKKTRNLFRRRKTPAIDRKAPTLTPGVTFDSGQSPVHAISCIPSHGLIAVATLEGVYIHESCTQGDPIRVFDKHEKMARGVVHLSDDILASVDDDGMLFTWRAATGVILDDLKVTESRCWSITKASAAEVLIGTNRGELIIVVHAEGRNLNVSHRYECESNGWIRDIGAYNNIFAAVTESNVEIWCLSTGQRLHSIKHEKVKFLCGAVSEDLIIVGGDHYEIYLHEIGDEYNFLRSIDLREFYDFGKTSVKKSPPVPKVKEEDLGWGRLAESLFGVGKNWSSFIPDPIVRRFRRTPEERAEEFKYSYNPIWIYDISFLNADIVMVTTKHQGIFFVSVESCQCISHCQLENSDFLFHTTVLNDGRVCTGGGSGYAAIFEPPQEIQHSISEFVECMSSDPVYCLIPYFSDPLLALFEGVQNETVSTTSAADFVVNTKFHCESIQKWTYAHLIIMAAIKSGDVPRSRKYNGDVIFWWNHLYKMASLMEMGQDDRPLVLKFIIEAEEEGLLGGGCAEMFQETNEIRSETNMLSTTIVDLYARQIAMDEQVRSILRYQRVQQAMSFVNAVIACIPFAGGAAVHVLSGGMAVLENSDAENFAISGLVESLFGVGKDWSSFISEPIVKRFLRAGDLVLKEETWNNIPEANRRAVETAADGLGLPIDELRRRLRLAAQGVNSPPCAIIVDKVLGEGTRVVLEADQGGTIVVDATVESLANLTINSTVEPKLMDERLSESYKEKYEKLYIAASDNHERMEGGPSETAENMAEERSLAVLWNKVKIMEQRNKKQEGKIEKLEEIIVKVQLRNCEQQAEIEEMKNIIRHNAK